MGTQHPDVAQSLHGLATLYDDVYLNREMAIKYLQQAFEIVKKTLSESHQLYRDIKIYLDSILNLTMHMERILVSMMIKFDNAHQFVSFLHSNFENQEFQKHQTTSVCHFKRSIILWLASRFLRSQEGCEDYSRVSSPPYKQG